MLDETIHERTRLTFDSNEENQLVSFTLTVHQVQLDSLLC